MLNEDLIFSLFTLEMICFLPSIAVDFPIHLIALTSDYRQTPFFYDHTLTLICDWSKIYK